MLQNVLSVIEVIKLSCSQISNADIQRLRFKSLTTLWLMDSGIRYQFCVVMQQKLVDAFYESKNELYINEY